MDRAERLQQQFDIEPVEGVKLNPLPDVGTPEEEIREEAAPEEGEQAQEPVVEDVQAEDTVDEPQEADTNWRLSSFDFADEVGLTPKEVYENIEFKTQDGPKSAKRLVEDYEALLASQSQWNQERQQLQQQAQQGQFSAIAQTVSPEAQKLMSRAELLEEQYSQIDWSQIPQDQRADLKIDFDRQIQGVRRQAYEKQQAWLGEAEQKRQQFEADTRRETLRLIPEWNHVDTYNSEVAAIRDMLANVFHFPQGQVEAILLDPRSAQAVRELWNLKREHATTTEGAKRIRKFSKTFKPSAKRAAPSNRLEEVGKRVRAAKTRDERQKARLGASFER